MEQTYIEIQVHDVNMNKLAGLIKMLLKFYLKKLIKYMKQVINLTLDIRGEFIVKLISELFKT